MSSLSRLSRVVKVACTPIMPIMLDAPGSGGLFRVRGKRGVGHVLEGRAGRLMLLGLLAMLGLPGVLRGRRILGALKIIASAGLPGVIVVGAMGVLSVMSVVVHVVAHSILGGWWRDFRSLCDNRLLATCQQVMGHRFTRSESFVTEKSSICKSYFTGVRGAGEESSTCHF